MDLKDGMITYKTSDGLTKKASLLVVHAFQITSSDLESEQKDADCSEYKNKIKEMAQKVEVLQEKMMQKDLVTSDHSSSKPIYKDSETINEKKTQQEKAPPTPSLFDEDESENYVDRNIQTKGSYIERTTRLIPKFYYDNVRVINYNNGYSPIRFMVIGEIKNENYVNFDWLTFTITLYDPRKKIAGSKKLLISSLVAGEKKYFEEIFFDVPWRSEAGYTAKLSYDYGY